jgi:methylenetetrahydrofolate dehydrogenase (NADP+)/methenyltetrahydrofolate cyclohydrolase
MIIINGKQTSLEIQEELKQRIDIVKKEGGKIPHLAAILVGDDGASRTYVNAKVKACERVGFESSLIKLSKDVSQNELLKEISKLNNDDSIDGFIVQLPLPKHIDETIVTLAVSPKKDVDGFHPQSVGRMALGLPTFLPATPNGVIELLKRYNIETSGKNCVVVGRSNIVGSPMSILMSRKENPGNATVTLTHSRTKNLAEITKNADILIVAIGKPHFITEDMVKSGAVVIDVGIHRIEDASKKNGFKLVGDVDFENVSNKCSYITPVPGGVGPMTIASLLMNTYKAIYN